MDSVFDQLIVAARWLHLQDVTESFRAVYVASMELQDLVEDRAAARRAPREG
jgi:hypothetical protein